MKKLCRGVAPASPVPLVTSTGTTPLYLSMNVLFNRRVRVCV